jgi:uncharacterized protein YbjT (DUF2867 family)
MLTGPVAITGASGHVGTAVRRRLEGLPNEVRPLGRDADLAAAFAGADAVIHLAGTLAPGKGATYESANLDTARAVAAALAGTSVRRVVDLSYATADPDSSNAYLRAKGRGERALAAAGVPDVTLRAPYIFGPPGDPGPSFEPFLSKDGKPVLVVGRGDQRIQPVFIDDVAEAIVRAALEPDRPTGTFAMAGPRELTLDAMVALINPSGTRLRHLPPALAKVLARVVPALNPTVVQVLLADSLPRDPSAADAFGVELHDPERVYA